MAKKKIYKLFPDPSAPELRVEEGLANKLNGKSVYHLSPNELFNGQVDYVANWNQFYRVGNSAFALIADAWEHCEEMYYALSENNIEFPGVMASNVAFCIINPLQIIHPANGSTPIFDLTNAGTIFRLANYPLEEVFCLEGITVPDDEIKRAYETHGFKGLIFEEIWSET